MRGLVPPNVVELIERKKHGRSLTEQEIAAFVGAYARGLIPDYQSAALLMAIWFRGLDRVETTSLTRAMLGSGRILDLRDLGQPCIDKHSTGGVGDKVSLILAPLVACCGICVPMISGRGLGHTGGTVDKLAAIPGFRTDLTLRRFKQQLRRLGVAMIGQTAEIAPADRRLYALRDVTATVDSIPLIAASIMSKKLAEDLDGLVLDVKFGSGAFMIEYGRAVELARTMVAIGKRAGVKTTAVMTDMNDALGTSVGNAMEVVEVVEALHDQGPPDLMEVTYALAEEMLKLARISGGRRRLEQLVRNGAAREKFRALVAAQGGDSRIVDDPSRLPVARAHESARSPRNGYVQRVDARRLGVLATMLGAGRQHKEDSIDPRCGLRIKKKTGDPVAKGEVLVEVWSDERRRRRAILDGIAEAYTIGARPARRGPLVREVIR